MYSGTCKLGIKYIATRSKGTDHIDKEAAGRNGIKLSNVPAYPIQAIAEHLVELAFSQNRELLKTSRVGYQSELMSNILSDFILPKKPSE